LQAATSAEQLTCYA